MSFDSLEFLIFLPVVFTIYWALLGKNVKARNLFIVLASYLFYGWWDWRFLGLIIISSFVDYLVGIGIEKASSKKKRKSILYVSVILNLGIIGFFKYFNFFIDSFVEVFTYMGLTVNPFSLQIILPVGISFYTFQTLSYSLDVYRGNMRATKDPIAFFAFVSFFPQLVAGPIERASNLLPQFEKAHSFDYENGRDGLRQILWGLFKKVVIADSCAIIANQVFNNYEEMSSSSLVLGAVLFAFQIYGDFSGYSDIAIGTARLFGFKLMTNFRYPYFSRDIGEFWRRWHISLSTWFRDYLYIPLGGSKVSRGRSVFNIFVIFLVSGIWHGANWTFVVWGGLNALYFLPYFLTNRNRRYVDNELGRFLPSLRQLLNMGSTFVLTCIAWVFFRSESVSHAFSFLLDIPSKTILTIPAGLKTLPWVLLLVVWEWLMRNKEHGLCFTKEKHPMIFRWGVYIALLLLIVRFFGREQPFIYFQF